MLLNLVLSVLLCQATEQIHTSNDYQGDLGNGLSFLINDTTYELTISGTGKMKNYSTYPTSQLPPWYNSYRTYISSIVIEEGVQSIGNYAFYGCTAVKSVSVPSTVTTFGSNAFDSCTQLTTINIPSQVTRIASAMFSGCTSLASLTIPDTIRAIDSYAFSGCTALPEIELPSSIEDIGLAAFRRCTTLASLVIPEKVTSVPNEAFKGCTTLTSITFNGAITSIGQEAFANCPLLKVTIPATVTSISDSAFKNCVAIESIDIPDGVTSLAESTFSGCTGLTSLNLNKLTTLGGLSFVNCTKLTSVTIPSSVETIGNGVFQGCTALTYVIIPSSVTTIGNLLFQDCPSFHDLYYAGTPIDWKGITFGGGNTFLENAVKHYQSTGPETVDVVAGVLNEDSTILTISGSGYMNDYSAAYPPKWAESLSTIKGVVVESGVLSVGTSAFYNHKALKYILLPTSLSSIGASAFQDCTHFVKVYYTGTEVQFNAITTDATNNSLFTDAQKAYSVDPTTDYAAELDVPEEPEPSSSDTSASSAAASASTGAASSTQAPEPDPEPEFQGVYNYVNASSTLSDKSIIASATPNRPVGILSVQSRLVVSNSTITGFEEYGIAASYQPGKGSPYLGVEDSTFDSCGKLYAAVFVMCQCTIVRCVFHKCGDSTKGGDGCGLMMEVHFNSTIANSNFTDSYSHVGAAIKATAYASLTITHCYFYNCQTYSAPASVVITLSTSSSSASEGRSNSNTGSVTITSSAFAGNGIIDTSSTVGVDAAVVVDDTSVDASSLVTIEKCYTNSQSSDPIVARVSTGSGSSTPIPSVTPEVTIVHNTDPEEVAAAASVTEDAGVVVEAADNDSSSGLSGGAVAGIVVAVIVVVIVIVLVVVFILICKRRGSSSSEAAAGEQKEEDSNTQMENVQSGSDSDGTQNGAESDPSI